MATWLYHIDCPKGRVFHSEEEVKKAFADGWVDAPGKCVEPKPKSKPVLKLRKDA